MFCAHNSKDPKAEHHKAYGPHGYRYGGAINRPRETTTVITVITRKVMTEYDCHLKGPLKEV